MNGRNNRLGIAAAATLLVTTAAGGSAFAAPGKSPNEASTADIALSGCVIESTKDISYLAFSGAAGSVKDESVNAQTVDLATIEGVEAYDSVEVKAGTTVESFAIDCGDDVAVDEPVDDGADDVPEEDEADDGTDDIPEEDQADDGADDGGSTEDGEDGGDSGGDVPGSARASVMSTAVMTVEECVVDSSKDISYLAFYDEGDEIIKTEPGVEMVDLTTVEGIETFDAVEVKAGTTVETFGIECGDAGADSPDGADDGADTGTGDGSDSGSGDGSSTDDGTAMITLSACVLESTKDISNIEFFSDGASLWKDESMNATSFDLTTVDGIDAVDTIVVKAGQTVEEFAISCTPTGATAV